MHISSDVHRDNQRKYNCNTNTTVVKVQGISKGGRIPETCMYVPGIITLPLLRYTRIKILESYQDLSRYLQRVGTKSAYRVGDGATPIQTRYGRNAVNTHSGATTLWSHNIGKCITPSTNKLLVCQRSKYNQTNCEFSVLPLSDYHFSKNRRRVRSIGADHGRSQYELVGFAEKKKTTFTAIAFLELTSCN